MSLLNTTIASDLEAGAYTARLLSYKEVDDHDHKPYVALLLEANGQHIEDRLYESRLMYFMRAIRPQLNLQFVACSLEEILDAATKNDFVITIEYKKEYGMLISYSA